MEGQIPLPVGNDRGLKLPVTDPTLLTTAQLNHEISLLKELIFTRLDASDKALSLYDNILNRVPSELSKEIAHVREAFNERFNSVTLQFAERDRRFAQGDHDSKDAIQAAFNAAKDLGVEQKNAQSVATLKSEAASEKRMEQLAALIQSNTKGLEDKISGVRDLQESNSRGLQTEMGALRDRLTLIEGKGFGQAIATTGHQASAGFLVAAFVAAVSFIGLLVALFNVVTSRS